MHTWFVNKLSQATIQVLDAVEHLVKIYAHNVKAIKQNDQVRPFLQQSKINVYRLSQWKFL